MTNKLILIFMTLSLAACISLNKKPTAQKPTELGKRDIKYYADKTVSSLEIPPDLTKPSSQNAFKLNDYVGGIKTQLVNFSDKKNEDITSKILTPPTNISVKKSDNMRWLVVDKKADTVWNLSKSFLKSHGFAIKKANKKIGVMETDYLENSPEIPPQSLNFIRAFLQKTINARYALPIADKYRIRIEPTENNINQSAVYLSLLSMEEVVSGKGGDTENTIWQARPKDEALETEMLYQLMIFLGSDHAQAKHKIINAKDGEKITVGIGKTVGGYAKLTFSLNKFDTWNNIGWALDQLDIDVEDKDFSEGSFYIHNDKIEKKGWFSRLFSGYAVAKSFRILVRQVSAKTTEVYFNDLSEKNDKSTIDFSHKFLEKIAKQF